jgi:hypothetical protein
MQAANETQILCRPQAIRVMTATLSWSGSKRFAGKSWSLPLLLRDHKEFARKLGRSFCDSLPAPPDNHHSISAHIPSSRGQYDNKAIVPATPSTTSCIFIDTSACLCVGQSAFDPTTLSPGQPADSSRDEDTINITTPRTAFPPPSRFHRNL